MVGISTETHAQRRENSHERSQSASNFERYKMMTLLDDVQTIDVDAALADFDMLMNEIDLTVMMTCHHPAQQPR